MARIELVEGIRYAVKKGDSLKDAMMSFFNAGYPKEEIEDAARIIQAEQNGYASEANVITQEKPLEQATKIESKPLESEKKETEDSSLEEYIPSAPTVNQKVSDYSSEKIKMKSNRKFLLIFLFAMLAVLGISITILLLFKDMFSS